MKHERSEESLFFAQPHEKQHFSERSDSCLSPEPPFNNMGVHLTNTPPHTDPSPTPYTIGIHYLTGTSRLDLDTIRNYLGSILGAAEFVDAGHGGSSYKSCLKSVYGAKIYFTEGREDILVWLPGQACEFIGHESLICAIEFLNLSCTRIDIPLDGHEVSPQVLLEAWEAGNVNSRVQRESFSWFRNSEGETLYLGGAKSERRICCYNQRGYNRLEFRLRGEMAYNLAESFRVLPVLSDRIQLVLGMLRAFVDFVDRSVDQNPTRCPQFSWWAALVGSAEKFRFSKENKEQSVLDYVARFIARQAASFATAVDMIAIQTGKNPLDVATEVYYIGKSRQKSHQRYLVGLYGSLPAYVPF